MVETWRISARPSRWSCVMWELGHKRIQHEKAQQTKVDKAARKQVLLQSSGNEEEGSGSQPVDRRDLEWVDEYIRRPCSRTGPYSHQGSLFSTISDLHLAGGPPPIRICSPALDNTSIPWPEAVVSFFSTFERSNSNWFSTRYH